MGLGLHAHVGQQLAHGGHIMQTRHIVQMHGLGGEQCGTHFRQSGVFGAGNDHFALEGTTTVDLEFVHGFKP